MTLFQNLMSGFFNLVRPFLHQADAEGAHDFTLKCLKLIEKPPFSFLLSPEKPAARYREKRIVAGLSFPNPVGVAPGFDKNAVAVDALLALGFGFVEVGTLTPRPQSGNPKPRLFRLTEDEAVINRMGFNNDGAEAAARRLRARREKNKPGIVGANIGANKDSEDMSADYGLCIDALYDCADYFTVNVSSPNTPGLRNLQNSESLQRIFDGVFNRLESKLKNGALPPVFLKIAPDLTAVQTEEIAETVNASPVAGVIATNTLLNRPPLKSPLQKEQGGLSGDPIFEAARETAETLKNALNPDKALIRVGGINSRARAENALRENADLIQIYSGLVYQGPGLLYEILKK